MEIYFRELAKEERAPDHRVITIYKDLESKIRPKDEWLMILTSFELGRALYESTKRVENSKAK